MSNKTYVEILLAAGINVTCVGDKFGAMVEKHQAKIEKALQENKANVPAMAVILVVLNKEEGIDFDISFNKDEKCSPEAKALKDELGVKDRPFNWKRAALITLGVGAGAGVSYGGYRWFQGRKSKAAEAAVMGA